MKKMIATLSLVLTTSISAFAGYNTGAKLCTVSELFYNGNGNMVVTKHSLYVHTLHKVALELGYSRTRIEFERTLIQSNGEFIALDVQDLDSKQSLIEGNKELLKKNEPVYVPRFDSRTVKIECKPEIIK